MTDSQNGNTQSDTLPVTGSGKILFNSETARLAGQKGGKAKGAKRNEDWAKTKADELWGDLYNAAKGRARFKNLAPEKQLQALLKFMEFAIGKPTTKKEEQGPAQDFQFGVAD